MGRLKVWLPSSVNPCIFFYQEFFKNYSLEGYATSPLHSTTESAFSEIEELSKTSKLYEWLRPIIARLKELKLDNTADKDDLIASAEVMENFLNCLKKPDYWLTSDELQMLAHIHNIRVEIIAQDIDGDFGCNNHLSLIPRNDDQRPLIVIHASGSHYSRCAPFAN
jgi:hypothetical protein